MEQHGNCIIVSRRSVTGAHIIPINWDFKVKRFLNGILRNFNARLCTRGDIPVEGVDYFVNYSPVVSWTTARLMLILSIKQGWATRKVDLSNAFVQDNLVEDVYLALPSYFDSETSEYRANMVMNLNKSIYGMVEYLLYWYNHLRGDFEAICFKPRPLDPYILYGRSMITLIYIDDKLFFGTDQDNIDEVIKKLEDYGISLTVDEDVYDFLGVEVKADNQSVKVTPNQRGLTNKVSKTVRMLDINKNITPEATI